MNHINKIVMSLIFFLLFSNYSYGDYANNNYLIQELNAMETDTSGLIEGVNLFTNEAYFKTREWLQQKYREMNPIDSNPKTLYYPGSGADICYPFLLFPTVEVVYAFALEEFGEVSDINKDRIEGKLPTKWHVAGTIISDLEGSNRFFAVPHYFSAEEGPIGWDESGYYVIRGGRVCADLLLRIKHVLQGTILEVNTINDFCHEIKFRHNGVIKKFVYLQYKKENHDNFKSFLLQLLPSKLDILFTKGINNTYGVDHDFLSFCTEPFMREESTTYNPMVTMSPSLPYGIKQKKEFDHKKFQAAIFKNLKDVSTIDTEFTIEQRFAFGYEDLVYVGPVKQLRTEQPQEECQ